MTPLLAQAIASYSIAHVAILIIVVAVVVAIVVVALQQMGIAIPPAVKTLLWIVAVGVIAIVLIKMFMGLA